MSNNAKKIRLNRTLNTVINTEEPISHEKNTGEATCKSKISVLKETFLEWSLTVDINCYAKAFEYKNNLLIQLVWMLILLASTGATFWLISLSIIDYLKFDIVTQTNMIHEVPTKFPAVTFCNNDPFMSEYAQALYEEVGKANGFAFSNQVVNDFNFLIKIKAASPAYGDENRKKLGFEQSVILSCKYNEKKCGDDLHWYYSFEFGNCWQYNSGFNISNHRIPVKDAILEGKEYGLSFVAYPMLYNKNKYMTTWDNGMVVFIHNSSFKPFSSDAIFVKPGEMSLITVKRCVGVLVFTNRITKII